MNASERPLIFVSHVSADAEATRMLQADLDERFIGSVQFFNTSSREALRAGESWLETIMKRLKESRIILPVLSPAALRSPWVNFETGGAWVNGGTVIPCCAGQVRKDSLPAPYSSLQAVNLDDVADLALLIERISQEVQLRVKTDGLDALAERMKSAFALSVSGLGGDAGYDLGSRIDEVIEIEWRFRKAEHDSARWAARYYTKRVVKVTGSSLKSLLSSFAPAIESVPFTRERPPAPKLLSWKRSSAGSVRLADPHRRTGSSYAFRLYFDPPLRQNDEVEFEYAVEFPEYRLGVREDYILAQLDHGHSSEIREYQQTSRTISQPTKKLNYRVILPLSLKAVPVDPEVTRDDTPFHDEQNFLLEHQDVYSVAEKESEGEPCWVMEINRANPPYKATYRTRWALPSKNELDLSK